MNQISDINILIITTAFNNSLHNNLDQQKYYKLIIDVVGNIISTETIPTQIDYIYDLTNKLINHNIPNLMPNMNNYSNINGYNIDIINYNYRLYQSCLNIFNDYFESPINVQIELKNKLQENLNSIIKDTTLKLTELDYMMIHKVIYDLHRLNESFIIDYNKIIKYLGHRYFITDINIINKIINNNNLNLIDVSTINYTLYYDLINILI
jgi:hypothetical protein